jgi:hypothetical protein
MRTLTVLFTVIVSLCPAALVEWTVESGGNGHSYEIIKDLSGITWLDAKVAAENLGGHLATITSEAENIFVYNLASSYSDIWWSGVRGPWLGGYQPPDAIEPAQGWQWVTGEPFAFTSWAGGEPNQDHGMEEDYLLYDHAPYLWNDVTNTNVAKAYVVEYVPEPTTLLLVGLGGLFIKKRNNLKTED